MIRLAASVLVTLVGLCFAARPAAALEAVPKTLDELIAESPRIVVVTCRGSDSRAVQKYGNSLFTFSRFDHVDTLAGDLRKPFELRLFGGRSGSTRIWEDGLPSFEADHRYLLFLGQDNADGFPLVKPQGVFELLPGDDGKPGERLRATLPQSNLQATLAEVRARVRAQRARKTAPVAAPAAPPARHSAIRPDGTGSRAAAS